ncbi:Protein of unknown function [Cotesia congregata]|uniref:Uncharacterized protein n=1 Tax=Cotesia congregata TaxID=51543 RepID=A0A8J2H920_COTCN|nr:Protein of unknown function [Cotesia congregata]
MCFPDELNPVAVTIDLIDVVHEIPRNETIESSVVVIDDNFSSKVIQKYYPRHPSFVLSGNSIHTLKAILLEIKSAEIWNVKSLFLIIGTQCQDSVKLLKLLWGIEAVASFFICRDDARNRTMIYTFNPYSNYAPRPWRRVEIDREPGNQWTLFRQPFSNDPTICQSIKFDKSKHLNGFPIRRTVLLGYNKVIIGRVPPTLYNWLSPVDVALFQNFELISNSTPVVYITEDPDIDCFYSGKCDLQILLFTFKQVEVNYYDFLSFYNQEGYVIVTNKQSTVLMINQIVENYFNVWTVSISCITLIAILIVIYINNNRNLREALMDMLALFLDMDLIVPLNRISMKIAFFSATLFMLMFNPAFQSQVTSYLTKPARQQIHTLEDLYQNKFHVKYDVEIHKELLTMRLWSNKLDKKYLHKQRYFYFRDCEAFLKRSSAACIISTNELFDKFPDEFHISKYLYFSEYIGVTILVLIIEMMHKRFKDWNEKRLRELRFKKLQARWMIACAIKQMAGVPQNMQNV